MDCFSEDPQPYEIVKFTPKKCKLHIDAIAKRNIRFTNPYEVANYFLILYSGTHKGLEELDLIFVKMGDKTYYFKNVGDALKRFTSKECTEEWQPLPSENITSDLESYIVLNYVSSDTHLIFQPQQSKEKIEQLSSLPHHTEFFNYFCVTNDSLWKFLQHSKKKHTVCTVEKFLDVFASKNVLEPLSRKCLVTSDANNKGLISVVVKKEPLPSSTRLIPNIPKYLVTKEGKVYGDGMKIIKHLGDKGRPHVELVVKGVLTSFYVEDLVESAWTPKKEILPNRLAEKDKSENPPTIENEPEEILPEAKGGDLPPESKIDHEDLPEIEEKNYLSHTEEAINAFVSLYTGDTWVDEVSKIIESNHETKKYFLSFLRSFASSIPKNEALEAALDTTKYEPLISLLDSEVVLVPDPVIYNSFDSM